MKAVADSRGVIAAAAMDQRGSLQKSLGKEKGSEANAKDLEDSRSTSPKC
jgi:tagatose 1,6-diphosphate aldolase